VHRIIHSDSVAILNWRIGGGRNTTARDDLYVSLRL
jgi:hypothetical protein